MANPLILVTGKNGQLGNELQLVSENYPQFNFEFTDVEELDITDSAKVEHFFNEKKPWACINAAAYTAVDKAEVEREIAMKINADAVGLLAKNCQKYATKFVHISTDYVFDGNGTSPYKEDYDVNPVNYYGLTKLKGEEQSVDNNPSSIIIRTSWVYSYFGNNFVKTMLRLMREKESINVINDQFGSPTYAADLADAIMKIISSNTPHPGIYHYSNNGIISWYDFAEAIKSLARLRCVINPISTEGYPTPAKRPAYSVMDKTKITDTFQLQICDWKLSLEKCMALLLK